MQSLNANGVQITVDSLSGDTASVYIRTDIVTVASRVGCGARPTRRTWSVSPAIPGGRLLLTTRSPRRAGSTVRTARTPASTATFGGKPSAAMMSV